MKRRPLLVFVLFLVATALLLAGDAAAQTQCVTAEALLNAQLYDYALTNYTAVLQQYPTLPCALNGVNESRRALTRNLYEQGLAYEKANQVDAAKVAYIGALKIDPNFSNATEALARLNGGILTKAYTWYTFLRPSLEFIVAVVIVCLALYALFFQIRYWIIGFLKPSLDIQEFDKGATGLEIGKGMEAMIGASYKQLVPGRHLGVNLVDGPTEKLAIPADERVAPYFKFVSELIDWLFPPYVIKLSGSLQKPGSLGAGITVTLVVNRTKEILGSYTIWQKELDLETPPKETEDSIDSTSYYNLAEPAAIWVLFKLGNYSKQGWFAEINTRVSALFQSGNRSEKKEFTIMGTNDWLSYVYFKAGVRWQREGKLVKAQQLYVESLGIDMENRGTLLNLGRMEMEEGQYQHAFERLKMAKEKSISDEAYKPEKSKDLPRNPIWYLASYSLALTYCYLSKRYESNLTKAKKETETLKGTINKSVDARQKKDKIVLECNLSMLEDEAKTLFELIQEAKDDLQIAEKISKRPAENTTHDLIDRIQESVKTIRGAIKAKNEENVDLFNEAEKIEKAINKLQNIKSAPFVFIMSQAEKEAKNLVDTIEKAIGLSMAEQDAKKLADTIREAIDTQQKNEDKYTSKAKEQADKLAEKINEVINGNQKSKDEIFKDRLSKVEERKVKLVNTINEIIDVQQRNEDQVLKDRFSEAKKQADKLVETIQKAISPRQKKDDKELKEFLELFNPMARIMYADTLLYVYGGEKIKEANEIIKRIDSSSLTYRGKYNMACYHSIVSEKLKNGKQTCYHSIVGEKRKEDVKRNAYRESLCNLNYALERGGGIVEWAKKDPDLEGVREDEEKKEDFAKMIKKYSPQETPHSVDLPLASLAIIGEAYAKQLKENKIVSYCDLILKAGTPSLREELAKKLGISTQLLHRWALLADLMGIVGNTQNANLLEEVGVGSLKALQNVSDICELVNLLNEINKAIPLVLQTTSPETVRQWVQEANKTELKVH